MKTLRHPLGLVYTDPTGACAPQAGDEFMLLADERRAREIAIYRADAGARKLAENNGADIPTTTSFTTLWMN